MKYVRLKIEQGNVYIVQDFNDAPLSELADFLAAEIKNLVGYRFFTEWLKGKYNQDYAYGNAYALTENGNEVWIHLQPSLIDLLPEDEKCIKFKTTKKELLDIIHDWLRAIFIYQDLDKPIPDNFIKPKELLFTQDEFGKVNIKVLDNGKNQEITK